MTALVRNLAVSQAAYSAPTLHVAGRWREGRHSKRHPVFDPATGKSIGSLGLASVDDINDAIAAAERGFEAWKRVPAFKRSEALHAASLRMQERSQEIARLLTLEQGKPLAEALAEVASTVNVIRWYAEEARPSLRPHHSTAGTGQQHGSVARAGRAVCGVLAVEFSSHACFAQARGRPGDRVQRRAEGRGRGTGIGSEDGRMFPKVRSARRRAPTTLWRTGRGVATAARLASHPQAELHWLGTGRT